jgi:hypothetical protein
LELLVVAVWLIMKSSFQQYDLNKLLEMYMQEGRAFSEALSKGASWQELKERHILIRMINECINEKYKDQYKQMNRRRDEKPPHES